MQYTVIIPAAGQGKRMGAGKNKQFIQVANKPLIVHTLEVFQQHNDCIDIIIVANKDEVVEMKQLAESFQIKKVSNVIVGGSERQYSVERGIAAVAEDGIVLVHDGARPFIKHEHIEAVVQKADEVGAAVVAAPVKDTIKRVQRSNIVEETLERSSLWAVQTPQAFRLSIIKEAHQHAINTNYLGTDDASLVEYKGGQVVVVQGDYLNIKVTTPEDLLFAEAILKQGEIK
ncbi:2-C-methyl-D-erythritol 4-phosphate cytidylyltransferase [Alkalihalobacillus sp. LMS39]|uniref:2-C-methyl-D-erythritol 4-phosphate cytidylyltransferase n=1 Tax=Alkalihalobacillus sp. LMS39 TaxID=2924032 RepID=UPI001FB3CA89|nr:2-C-methyl-D-erythritol 4-phosphate cytidylyltransferase [Alkalihalobacillus sp. LMS39]UOE94227.1 2-C-methyl-D-erythritol 4-phosphate cytidylyltransferase [Alkalihalobacillus sp. LMS39]